MKRLLFLMGALALLATSCKKYEEGPGLTFRSVEKRINGTWELEQHIADGEDLSFPRSVLKIHENGDFDYKIYDVGELSGSWELQRDDEIIRLYFDGGNEAYEILRLTMKELKLERNGEEFFYSKN